MNVRNFESMRWNASVHKLDLGLYSHPKEFGENGIRNHVNSKGKNLLNRRLRGGSNPRCCITQDSEAQHTTDRAIAAPLPYLDPGIIGLPA